MKKIKYLIAAIILSSCGGGGSGSSSSSAAAPSYFTLQTLAAQTDLTQYLSIASNFSEFNRGIRTRESSDGEWICTTYDDDIIFSAKPDANGTGLKYLLTAHSGSGDCAGADVSGEMLSISGDKLSTPLFFNFNGFYSGSLERLYDWDVGVRDSNTLAETAFDINGIKNETDGVTSYWSGTSYVDPQVFAVNYGDTCAYIDDRCYDLRTDTKIYDTDFIASITGDRTLSADMPSGSDSYTSKVLAVGYYGFHNYLNSAGYDSWIGNCSSSNVGSRNCRVNAVYSVSAAHILLANFSANTLTGDISLENHYKFEFSQTDITSSFPIAALANLAISASISGTGFSGTISNEHFEGTITGYFFGPNATEIGATIILVSKTSSSIFPKSTNIARVVISLAGY